MSRLSQQNYCFYSSC